MVNIECKQQIGAFHHLLKHAHVVFIHITLCLLRGVCACVTGRSVAEDESNASLSDSEEETEEVNSVHTS